MDSMGVFTTQFPSENVTNLWKNYFHTTSIIKSLVFKFVMLIVTIMALAINATL